MGLRLLTGHDGFDFITGGLPVEGILNIWGKPSTGKTSIARMIIREVSPFQSIIAYGLDSSLFEQSGDYLQMREPDYEKGLEACLDYLSAGHIVVIDELSVILANSPVAGAHHIASRQPRKRFAPRHRRLRAPARQIIRSPTK